MSVFVQTLFLCSLSLIYSLDVDDTITVPKLSPIGTNDTLPIEYEGRRTLRQSKHLPSMSFQFCCFESEKDITKPPKIVSTKPPPKKEDEIEICFVIEDKFSPTPPLVPENTTPLTETNETSTVGATTVITTVITTIDQTTRHSTTVPIGIPVEENSVASTVIVIVFSLIGLVAICVIAYVVICGRRKKKKKKSIDAVSQELDTEFRKAVRGDKIPASAFKYRGPLVIYNKMPEGELKHAVSDNKGKSIKEVVWNDDAHEAVEIGSNYEKMLYVCPDETQGISEEQEDTKTTQNTCASSSRANSTEREFYREKRKDERRIRGDSARMDPTFVKPGRAASRDKLPRLKSTPI